MPKLSVLLALAVWIGCSVACASKPGVELRRRGDEIVIAGRYFHTGTPVVLWTDPGGYDAYRTEKRFAPWAKSAWSAGGEAKGGPPTPNRSGIRFADALSPEEFERVRGGGWTLPQLQDRIDQFVVHYDVCGTSRQCFRVLHDMRGLSVHFMLDLDGTIYQTLDVKERAWHATTSNDRSVGIEIANIGAYPPDKSEVLAKWYAEPPLMCGTGLSRRESRELAERKTVITIPAELGDGGVRTGGVLHGGEGVLSPRRNGMINGVIQGQELVQYDLTPQQYEALIRLTATICRVLPRVRCDYPKDEQGKLITTKLPDGELAVYSGLIGHYHIQDNKTDPGPAFDWEYVTREARRLLPWGCAAARHEPVATGAGE